MSRSDPIDATPVGAINDDEFSITDYDGSSSIGGSTSINSSLYKHSFENGRRYHRYRHGRYPIPNDDSEQNREDMKHAATLELVDGKLFFAPIGDHPQTIIDLGTGTGIWAVDVADRYPSAVVIGVDLSPIQPPWVPPNVKFIVDDVEDEWLNGNDFDFVHMRHMASSLKNVEGVVTQAFEHIKLKGWMELQDFGGELLCDDGTMPDDWPPKLFMELASKALRNFGLRTELGRDTAGVLRNAGFVNVGCEKVKTPVGKWPKNKTLKLVGMYIQFILADLVSAMGAKPFKTLGWQETELQLFLANVRKELQNTSVHSYMNYYFAYGQKPGA